MAILVPRWLDSSWQVRLQMCLKVCMVKIANRTRAQTRSTLSSTLLTRAAAKARNWARTDPMKNILRLGNGELWGTRDTGGFLKIHHRAPYKLLRRARCHLN